MRAARTTPAAGPDRSAKAACAAPSSFFNNPPTTDIYTLSLHDALPISGQGAGSRPRAPRPGPPARACGRSEEHTSELQSQSNLVCRLLLEKKDRSAKAACAAASSSVSRPPDERLTSGVGSPAPAQASPS